MSTSPTLPPPAPSVVPTPGTTTSAPPEGGPKDSAAAVVAGTKATAHPSRPAQRDASIDRELLRRFNSGDEGAFAGIIERHRTKIFSVAFSVLRNRADAEEIAQDTFIRAHRGLALFRGESSLATWLHHICLNLARNRYWYFFRRRRHATVSLDCARTAEGDHSFAEIVPCDSPGPGREVVMREFSSLIADCLGELDTPHRTILTLWFVRHHSYGTIAAMLGISVGTVKSRIARARTQLKSLLAQKCPELTVAGSLHDWLEPSHPPSCGDFAAA